MVNFNQEGIMLILFYFCVPWLRASFTAEEPWDIELPYKEMVGKFIFNH